MEYFFVQGKGWTQQHDLKPGDQVRQKDGIWYVVGFDRVTGTTHEHPYLVKDRGWASLEDLRVGDQVRVPQWATVEAVIDTGRFETVYNFRVADTHTYFVGCQEWGFSVWAHNSYSLLEERLAVEGRTLLVGEGDFSFALALARRASLDPARHTLVATDLTQGGYRGRAGRAIAVRRQQNIEELCQLGFEVHDNVNATNLSRFAAGSFENVIWMGAWPAKTQGAGSRGAQQRAIKTLRDELVVPFLREAANLLTPEGRIYMAWEQTRGHSATTQGRDNGLHRSLAVPQLFTEGGPLAGELRLTRTAEFIPANDYAGYTPVSNWKSQVFSPNERWKMYEFAKVARSGGVE